MSVMQYEFRLFGGRAGKTAVINGHKFVHGIHKAVVSPHQAAPLIKVLSFYAAYAKGTPEYDEAMEAEKYGGSAVHEDAEQGASDEVSSGVGSDGSESAASPADDGPGAGDSAADGARSGASGDGHGHAGVLKFEEAASIPQPSEPASVGNEDIKVAVLKLDPENDNHWVNTGAHKDRPRLSAVEDAYGKAGLTRQDLEAAIPNWTRNDALVAALED